MKDNLDRNINIVDKDARKLLSILAHLSLFFSCILISFLIPIGILLISEDRIVHNNAKEAINFHLNLYIFGFIFLFLSFVLIGIPFLIGLVFASFLFPIIAVVKTATNPNKAYRYPLVIRFF